jgi:hypothetical protein
MIRNRYAGGVPFPDGAVALAGVDASGRVLDGDGDVLLDGPAVSVLTPVAGAVATVRRGSNVSNTGVNTKLTLQDAFRLPADIIGFRIGHHSNESSSTTFTLTKYAFVGAGMADTPTQAINAVANYNTSSPKVITYGGSGQLVLSARKSQDRPADVQWSDWIFDSAAKGKVLVIRKLMSAAGLYPAVRQGFDTYATLLADTAYPVGGWSDTIDRVTADAFWGTNASNAVDSISTHYVEFLTASTVINVAQFGDSTTAGMPQTGDWGICPLTAACEQLSTGSVLFSSTPLAWPGKKQSEYFEYLLGNIALRPQAIFWQIWSQNDSSADLGTVRPLVLDFIRRCRANGIVPVLDLSIPLNTSGATLDNMRKANDTWSKSLGVVCCDRDAVISDGASPARYKSAYGTSGHPNRAGYADLATGAYVPALKEVAKVIGFSL